MSGAELAVIYCAKSNTVMQRLMVRGGNIDTFINARTKLKWSQKLEEIFSGRAQRESLVLNGMPQKNKYSTSSVEVLIFEHIQTWQ